MNPVAKRVPAATGLWDAEALWAKAVLYAQRAVDEPRGSPWFPFFGSLAAEHLGRSVLADVHPSLLADPREEENIFYAFDVGRTSTPRSVPAHTVFSRCARFVEEFTDEMSVSMNAMAERRNEELHTAGVPFAELDSAAWLPKFYRAVEILCVAKGHDLSELFGDDEAEVAAQLIAEADAATVKAVKARIGRAGAAAAALEDDERSARMEDHVWPSMGGRRSWEPVDCPACGSAARLYGALTRTQAPRLRDGEIIETEIYVRDLFDCAVCELELSGHMELDAASLAGSFSEETSADPDEYYGDRYMERYGGLDEDYGND